MNKILEINFSGWTATPRLPFIISGNALCMPMPSYSIILGIIGCCLGRFVSPSEVKIGFRYDYDTISNDIETRRRLCFDGKRIKVHDKGSDAYQREFHTNPVLTLWIDRIDWKCYFDNPVGTPSLGRSQDLLKITSVKMKDITSIDEGYLKGCMIPFDENNIIPGQLMQFAEAYEENASVESGRFSIASTTFVAIYSKGDGIKVKNKNLYKTIEDNSKSFYLHTFYGS
jgi:CRISPR-associated protein Cas5t